jgi:glycosyltransferase involved in cell wall biosynthesis
VTEPAAFKKIAFYSGLLQGGAERQVVKTAELLWAKGHEVTIHTYDLNQAFYRPRPGIRLVDHKKSKASKPPVFDKILSTFRLGRAIREDAPDAVIAYETFLNVVLGFVRFVCFGRRPTTLFLGSERNTRLLYTENRGWALICAFLYKRLDVVFANTPVATRNLHNRLGLDPEATAFLPNLLDVDHFRPASAVRPSGSRDSFTILVPARITPQKNQTILPAVARLLQDSGVPVRFLLAGRSDPDYHQQLQKQIDTYRVAENFEHRDRVDDMLALYWQSDLVFLPSRFEGLSNSMIEAQASGALFLGSDIPSFTEFIEDDGTGFIVPVDQPSTIAAKIQQIWQLPDDEKNRIREAARQTILSYGPEPYYERLMAILVQAQARRQK